MAEVLAVLAIISVLAAVATPGFVSMLRDRRTAADAGMFTDAFRVARARSLGRGAAVRVDIVHTTTSPYALMLEHVSGTIDSNNVVSASSLPVPGCTAIGVWRTISAFQARPNTTTLVVNAPSGSTLATNPSICYTPRGRTFYSADSTLIPVNGGGGYVPLDGVVQLQLNRSSSEGASNDNTRRVFVLPNGLTRMSL